MLSFLTCPLGPLALPGTLNLLIAKDGSGTVGPEPPLMLEMIPQWQGYCPMGGGAWTLDF